MLAHWIYSKALHRSVYVSVSLCVMEQLGFLEKLGLCLKHTRTHTHTHTCIYSVHTHVPSYPHTYMHTYTYTGMCKCAHAHVPIHTHTHTHTHTLRLVEPLGAAGHLSVLDTGRALIYTQSSGAFDMLNIGIA